MEKQLCDRGINVERENLLETYLALAKEHGKCASMYWHMELLIWLTMKMRPKVILELGTYCGGSFYCFMYGLLASNNEEGHVYTVDIVDRSDKLTIADQKYFTHIICDAKTVDVGKPIDFLFIDDDHTYEQVMAEWEKHEPNVNVGGLIFFHDSVSTYPEPDGQPCGVSKALAELWAKHKDRFARLVNYGAIVNGDPCGLEIWIKLR